MPLRTPSSPPACFVACLSFAYLLACDGPMQSVSITAEDFRFAPDHVQVKSVSPLKLSVYNAGREIHEFDSAILMYAAKRRSSGTKEASPGIQIAPGESFEIIVAPPPGIYLYICRRKGHANMTGTFIVD